ncbi:MAG: UbiD family decarboxylase [Anaerolineae bacterium]|nr:UbiD family decarboxylase [Anaerolineae bacterium]
MNLRTFLQDLDARGELFHIQEPVSPHLEVARRIAARDGQPMLFEQLAGFSEWRMAAGFTAQRAHFARALGCGASQLVSRMAEALAAPQIPPQNSDGPCQEVVWDSIDLTRLPIPRYHPQDGGPYITAGVAIIHDPDLGRNLCFHRMRVQDARRLVVRVVENRGTHTAWRKAPEGIPMAICVGLPPHILLAASMAPPEGQDESGIAQAFAPSPMVKAKTVPLEVFAEAELVLEGILTHALDREGPFPDLTGTMDRVRQQPVLRVTAVTHRKNPIFHALLPAGLEHKNLMGMPREPTIFAEVNRVARCTGVTITPGGCSWLHAVVQIDKQGPDDARLAIEAAFRGHRSLKHVVIVDTDVDIYNPQDVEWALATRMQARRDLVIFPDQASSSLDPSAHQSPGQKALSDKIGIDATIPWGASPEDFVRVTY